MDWPKSKIFFPFFFLLSILTEAATISGKVTDENNEPLPYVSIYLRGTTQGVTSNKDGDYSIDVAIGQHVLVFQCIGYRSKQEIVNVQTADQVISLSMKMDPQPFEITEVVVKGGGEDPAYEVMRKAIRMRKYYASQVESYSCNVYIKGVQRVKSYPKKFMGIDVNAEGDIDPKTGIFYLSESVSKFKFRQPDQVHETMVSSKVSGNSKAFSFNRTSDLLLDFYKNVVPVSVISKRGFVSPVADGAMFYYRFRLVGAYYENGNLVNKIEVIPKRENDPVFRGFIFICENTWRIHSTDLYLVKNAGIEFVDTIRINQVHLPAAGRNDVWMLFSNKLSFNFSLLGFKGSGIYLGIHSQYQVVTDPRIVSPIPLPQPAPASEPVVPAPVLTKKEQKLKKKEVKKENAVFTSGEMMKVNDDANKKDSSYWTETRPVPLTEEEQLDYKKKDSIQVIKESKPFLDSVDRRTNRFELADLFFGYSHINRYKKREISFSPLIENLHFNTVQGTVAGLEVEVRRKYENERRFYRSVRADYGIADRRINASGRVLYEFSPKKFSHVALEGGRKTVQFNERLPISRLVNSFYSLFLETNYMKLYQKDFLKLTYNSELANGIYLRSYLEYSDRAALLNESDFTFFPAAKNYKTYTSNDPLDPQQDSLGSFPRSQSLEFRVNLRLRYKQRYVSRPDDKWVFGSKYPTLHLEYRKGVIDFLGSDVNYDLVRISLTDRMNFKLLGKASYQISAGKFLNNRRMEFMDHYHFSGNKTLFSNFDFSDFQLLDYYSASTRDFYLEGHYEHDFSGFILNKFPLLRKLKLNELAGAHYLYNDKQPHYLELFFGLEKLNLLRVDFVMALSENKTLATGFRFGLKVGR